MATDIAVYALFLAACYGLSAGIYFTVQDGREYFRRSHLRKIRREALKAEKDRRRNLDRSIVQYIRTHDEIKS